MKALFFSRFFNTCKLLPPYPVIKKVMCSALVLMFTFGLWQPYIQAQNISKIGANKFEYQGTTYKYADMGPVFSQHGPSYAYYLKAKNRLKKGKTLGIVSLSGIAVGFIGGATYLSKSDSLFDDEWEAGLLILFFGGLTAVTTGIPAIILHFNGKKLQKRSVASFNEVSGDTSYNGGVSSVRFFLHRGNIGFSVHF